MRLLLRLIGLGLSAVLLTCKPTPDNAVLPGVARIAIVANNNQQQLFFVENSSGNQITLNVTYYDATNSIVTVADKPQFLVNGKPFEGNTYTLDQAGQYRFTARIGTRVSDNEIGPLTVSRVADYVSAFSAKSAVAFVNADSVSRLPIVYQVLDKSGNPLNLLYYSPKLLVNGSMTNRNDAFATGKAGEYTLEADFLGLRSAKLRIVARKPIVYPVVKLPVIIHLPKGVNAASIDPAAVLADVNKTFRKRNVSVDPNQADTYIEFFPATTNPAGQPLAVAGLDQLEFSNPASAADASALVTTVLHNWCPLQYINVFLNIDWLRTYPAGYSFSYLPDPATAPYAVTCEEMNRTNWTASQIPAIYINGSNSFGVLGHELGHFLSLQHTFAAGCSATQQVSDTPKHEEAYPIDGIASKYTCDRTLFLSQYVMDYHVYQYSFTYGQAALMQTHARFGAYIPASIPRGSGRRGIGAPVIKPTGKTVACLPY